MRVEDTVRIRHMIGAAESALSFIKDRTRSDLGNDQMLQFALVRAVEVVGEALELLKAGLGPFVERGIKSTIAANTISMPRVKEFVDDPKLGNKSITEWDDAALLKLMWETWNDVFRKTLGFSERSLVSEIRDWRNKWAHQQPFSTDDAYPRA